MPKFRTFDGFEPLKERQLLEPVANVHQLSQLTVKYIKLEEAKKVAKRVIEVQPRRESQRSPKKRLVWDRLQINPKKKQRGRSPQRENGRIRQPQEPIYTSYTPLSTTIGRMFAQMKDRKMLPRPQKIKAPPNRRGQKRYCEYH
ncbi:hypothetical protein LIER_06786 [Lithospermum erythrorhizon]|uniref:Uncharacterized protein n=1 Tax=Lithospermum erythrorhizon TaxID=34254 RepID=A0AAV3P6I7_LITER